jgi:hypothetical protein
MIVKIGCFARLVSGRVRTFHSRTVQARAPMRFSGQKIPSGHMSQEEMPITLLFFGICSLIKAEKISGEHKFRRDFGIQYDQDQEVEGLTSTLCTMVVSHRIVIFDYIITKRMEDLRKVCFLIM